jgi:ribosomal protein S18 acetylase RimI-like enzyme
MKSINVKGQKIIIRNYLPVDEKQVRDLCCETGFLGDPIDVIFKDHKWFADLNTKYYLRYEPESCFVAEANREIIGYVLGCKNPLKYTLIFYPLIAIPLFLKAFFKCLTKKYNKESREFIQRLITRGSRERPKRPKKAGHLHINIKEEYRGLGIGRALVENLFHYFLKKGVTKVYGELTFVENRQTEEFYTKHGFIIYDKKPTTIWGNKIKKAYLMTIFMDLEKWARTQKKQNC